MLGQKGTRRRSGETTYDSSFEEVDVLIESSVKLIVDKVVESSIEFCVIFDVAGGEGAGIVRLLVFDLVGVKNEDAQVTFRLISAAENGVSQGGGGESKDGSGSGELHGGDKRESKKRLFREGLREVRLLKG
jgi:hypothetical protein